MDWRGNRAHMPHCDSRILHSPGSCEYCDNYPELQEARTMWGINFTGEYDQQTMCPSELTRNIDDMYKWPGNRPKSGPTFKGF